MNSSALCEWPLLREWAQINYPSHHGNTTQCTPRGLPPNQDHTLWHHFTLATKRRRMVWGGRKEEGSGWGTHIYLWRIHVDIWQNQYNIVKLKNKIKLKKNKRRLRVTLFKTFWTNETGFEHSFNKHSKPQVLGQAPH